MTTDEKKSLGLVVFAILWGLIIGTLIRLGYLPEPTWEFFII